VQQTCWMPASCRWAEEWPDLRSIRSDMRVADLSSNALELISRLQKRRVDYLRLAYQAMWKPA
jgi:hypothetical protein